MLVEAILIAAPSSAAAQNDEICYITNVDFFQEQCPTLDPAIDEILSDFRITRDGIDVTEFECEEPMSTLPAEQYTTELRLLQALRTAYYVDKGRTGHLPWTDQSLYDWLKSKVGGFNINSSARFNSCCGVWPNGDRFITLIELSELGRTDPIFRAWPLGGRIGLIMHEARHVDGFSHPGCCPSGPGGCDQRYDESNLSPHAIQWWLERAFLNGTLYTGYSCLDSERAEFIAGHLIRGANNRRDLFCESPPPILDEGTTAPCLDCQPPMMLIATDDGPFEIDEGGEIVGTFNILENDMSSEDVLLMPVVVDPPAHASFFEVRPDGTFDYRHDGSETTSDSFTYRASDGINESDIAVVSVVITAVNDAPQISLIGDSLINLIGGDTFSDPGAIAEDAEDGDINDSIVVGGDSVDTNTEAAYTITYDVVDSDGLAAEQVIRTVNVAIDDPPLITLIGSANLTLTVGELYTEQGTIAQDPEDGDISEGVVIGGDAVNTSIAGTYVVTYNVTDSAGNAADEVIRTVNVAIDDPPIITLIGSASLVLTVGDTYTEQGTIGQDPEDGDISEGVVIGGDAVNTSIAGTYVVTYNVTDSAGNVADEVIRTVTVNPAPTVPTPRQRSGGGLFGLWELVTLALAGFGFTRRRFGLQPWTPRNNDSPK